VSEPGCELLIADDYTGPAYVERRYPSELDHYVLHLRRRLGRGWRERLFLVSRAICSCEDAVVHEATDAIKSPRHLRLGCTKSD